MAGLIPNDFIDDLLERTDIVEIIGHRVPLKKKGKDHWACCPFHNEKSPSFSVNSTKQFYYCFGCGASGTALKFLQEYERLSFPEAVEELARAAGVEVPREEQSPAQKEKQRRRRTLYDLMDSCTDYFGHQLYNHPSAPEAQQYVLGRGLSEEIVQRYRIGYAPSGWQNLIQHFASADQGREQLLATGMIIRNDNGREYDRFRHRLMFPIRDIRGRTIAFGGRVLTPDDKPKYLNSPETPIFHKGHELYGLYEARQALRNFDNIIIVEGYMDVVALAQHGVKNAVATLGTATSRTHVQRLFKLTPEIVFCFDGDEAGRRAALRALENTLSEIRDGQQARFLFLPEGEDPDTLVRKEGFEAFMRRVRQAQSLPDFLFQHLQTQADVSTLDGKARLASVARGWIDQVPEGVLHQLLLQQLSNLVGLPVDQILKSYEPVKPALPEQRRDSGSQPPDFPPDEAMPAYADPGYGAYEDPDGYEAPVRRKGLGVQFSIVHRCLAWLIRYPELARELDLERLTQVPEQEGKPLLTQVVKLLQEAPRADVYHAFDYLCQHGLRATLAPIAASDYLWLEEHAHGETDPVTLARTELEKLIGALTKRAPDAEYESLKQRIIFDRDPSVTKEEKQRFLELQKKRKL
ncbi:DNA primase [Saccharospirillum salsuginis]|uniref:DNA primase n=1 Tax=Saccharospirillum salsuginis TaxID=418750 RepID=A0A918K3N0_9GAMM|nr:DNA primase [Saccharospirillum salsuginis]GGX45440.1 DNA primase [Saccharospirillum salsuginis]